MAGLLPAAPATSFAPSPDPLSLVTGSLLVTGALTVVAAALQAGQPVDRVVWMGGAVAAGGNMTATAEFNAWLDPEACDRVLASGIALAMVPLDITHQVSFDPAELGVMAGLGTLAGLSAHACARLPRHGRARPTLTMLWRRWRGCTPSCSNGRSVGSGASSPAPGPAA